MKGKRNIVKHMCGSRGETGGPDPPLKNYKSIGFSSNTGPDPLKNRSYQASIQSWSIIGTPAKRHLMAFRWRADDGPLIYLDPPSPHQLKKQNKKNVVKVGPPLTKLSGSAHETKLIVMITFISDPADYNTLANTN